MRKALMLLVILAAVLAAISLPVAADAKKSHHAIRPANGTYTGTIHTGVVKVVSLKVSRQGTTAVLSLTCNGTPVPYPALHMPIVKGAFHASHQLSPGLSWGISGHFTTRTTASAHFNGQGLCDGKSGNLSLAS